MKMKCFQKKWMCICLILIITLSGMYFEGIKADSISEYLETGKAVPHFLVSDTISQSGNYSADELGIRDVSRIMNINRRVQENSRVRTILILSVLAIQPDNSIKVQERVSRLTNQSIESRNIIISYIHHQDGEKSRLS